MSDGSATRVRCDGKFDGFTPISTRDREVQWAAIEAGVIGVEKRDRGICTEKVPGKQGNAALPLDCIRGEVLRPVPEHSAFRCCRFPQRIVFVRLAQRRFPLRN